MIEHHSIRTFAGEVFMICPSCHKQATTFLRFSFTRQGVSFVQSTLGYFKCAECGVLLKVYMLKRILWYYFSIAAVSVLLFAFNYKTPEPIFRFDSMAVILVLLFVFLFSIFTAGLWKYSKIELSE